VVRLPEGLLGDGKRRAGIAGPVLAGCLRPIFADACGNP
jgi:hypothetical protein